MPETAANQATWKVRLCPFLEAQSEVSCGSNRHLQRAGESWEILLTPQHSAYASGTHKPNRRVKNL